MKRKIVEHHFFNSYISGGFEQSKIVADNLIMNQRFRCPRCKVEATYPIVGRPGQCELCDLEWIRHTEKSLMLLAWVDDGKKEG